MSGGDELIGDVRAWLDRFIVTMNGDDTLLLALWSMHTHLATELYTTGRLLIDSAMPGSGKTTCLEHVRHLAHRPVQMATVSSPAMIPRMLQSGPRTLLIDEADRSLSLDKEGAKDIAAVLNSGYKRGATRPVLVPVQGGGWDAQEMSTFAPVAMAGNNPNLEDDTRSRCIRVLLLPDMHGEAEDSDWELIEDDAIALGTRVSEWADSVRDAVPVTRSPLPSTVRGRFREKWLPLRRVAELAGGTYVVDVDRMAVADVAQSAADREDGLVKDRPAIVLLRDLAQVWPADETFVSTAQLIAKLTNLRPETWGEAGPFGKALTAQRFGRMLSQSYRVNSDRPGGVGPRGYTLATLLPVFHRMQIPPPDVTGRTGGTGETGGADLLTHPTGSTGLTGFTGHTGGVCIECGDPLSEQRAAVFDDCPACRRRKAVGA